MIVSKYVRMMGVPGTSFRTLRHIFGTHHATKGTSIKTIQDAMGHQDIRTTSLYLSLAQQTMREELQSHVL